MSWAGIGIMTQLQENNQEAIAYFRLLTRVYPPHVKALLTELVNVSTDLALLSAQIR